MAKVTPIVLDFETYAIEDRPAYPPEPVGFSIKFPKDKKSKYYAWGHPTGNNCDRANAKRVLERAWASDLPILFHNAKFDLEVAEQKMGMKRLPWERIHDTLFLVFLDNPHAESFGLKPSAERLLGMAPVEQESLSVWLRKNQPVPNVKITEKNSGAYIAFAPGELVGEYADGDVIRTAKLFDLLYSSIVDRGMLAAYNRELRLLPILLDNERTGMRIDTGLLDKDIAIYSDAAVKIDNWLRKRLKAPSLNLDSNDELADALDRCGIVTEWNLTPTGKRSTSKENLTLDMYKDARVASAVGYRNRLGTLLGTFMLPWQGQSAAMGGTINTSWNQVRQAKGGSDSKGTRTGRPSSMRPNFLNVPKSLEDRKDGYAHPAFVEVPELPLVRKYILPDKGGTWLHRDYNQQELRILAHFENDQILAAYNDNPDLDIHQFVQDEIKRITGLDIPRLPVKMMNFGRVYGEGLGSLAERLKAPIDEIKKIRAAQNRALPGLPRLEKEVKTIGKMGECVITWGGREYYVEPPKFSKKYNKHMSFEYKLLNYLIQGSAADCTKEAVIRYSEARRESRFLVTVYDEINISAPAKYAKQEMKILRDCMEGIKLDVPMKSDGKSGTSWGTLTKYEESKK